MDDRKYSSSRRVLVVSQDEKLQQSLSHALTEQGCDAVTAQDGVDAQKIFEADWYFVGIFLDSRIRNPASPILVKFIRGQKLLKSIPVIVVSAYWTIEESNQSLMAGAMALVSVTATDEQFQSVIATTIGARTKSIWG